jgi:hypothetical protein
MIEQQAIDQLRELGPKIKAIMAGVSGQVIFNCSKDPKHQPVVNIMAADVTEAKK